MIEEEVVVMGVGDDFIRVEPYLSACASCQKGCLSGLLGPKWQGNVDSVIQTCETEGLQTGQRVVIGIDESVLLGGILRTFLFPLFATLVGAMLGDGMAHFWFPGSANGLSACGAGLFLLISLGINRLNSALSSTQHQIHLLRRAD